MIVLRSNLDVAVCVTFKKGNSLAFARNVSPGFRRRFRSF